MFALHVSIREPNFSAGSAMICFKFSRNHKFSSLLFPVTLGLQISINVQFVLNKQILRVATLKFNVLRQKDLISLKSSYTRVVHKETELL